MRITSEAMVMRSVDRLHTRLQRYERSQSELATGRRIMQPSDDPAGARRSMSLRASMAAREQDLRNVTDAMGWFNTADAQLQSASDRLGRVRALATAAASEAGPGERAAMAMEIRQIGQELVGIANTRHLDRPLFGGFSGGDAVEQVGGVWVSHGDGEQVTRRVSDTELVPVNVTAGAVFGFGSADGDLFTVLEGLAQDIEAGDQMAVSGRLGEIQRASGRIADGLSTIGAATNRVESARARADDLLITLRTELSNVEDVDLAKGIMELQVQQVAYEATLQALGKALPPSLVAFLR